MVPPVGSAPEAGRPPEPPPIIQAATDVAAARQAIRAGLRDFVEARVGPTETRPIVLTLRQNGRFGGGFAGHVVFGWLFVELLWIETRLRGTGQGRALMERGEAEARQLGATRSYLNSFSFQAPDFYRKLGYREYGRLDDFPAGSQRVFLMKVL